MPFSSGLPSSSGEPRFSVFLTPRLCLSLFFFPHLSTGSYSLSLSLYDFASLCPLYVICKSLWMDSRTSKPRTVWCSDRSKSSPFSAFFSGTFLSLILTFLSASIPFCVYGLVNRYQTFCAKMGPTACPNYYISGVRNRRASITERNTYF